MCTPNVVQMLLLLDGKLVDPYSKNIPSKTLKPGENVKEKG